MIQQRCFPLRTEWRKVGRQEGRTGKREAGRQEWGGRKGGRRKEAGATSSSEMVSTSTQAGLSRGKKARGTAMYSAAARQLTEVILPHIKWQHEWRRWMSK